jgi:hypothetical protein
MSTTNDLERIEIDAWRDLCAAAPPPFAAGVGLMTVDLGGPLLALCRRIDHYQFNRLIGAGLGDDADGRSLDAGAERFREAGLCNGFLQIAPGPRALALEAKARAMGLTPNERVWVKFRRERRSISVVPWPPASACPTPWRRGSPLWSVGRAGTLISRVTVRRQWAVRPCTSRAIVPGSASAPCRRRRAAGAVRVPCWPGVLRMG